MGNLFWELRLAIRRIQSQITFTLIGVISLAFGIGATTVFFSVMNSTLLKPLPVAHPEQLYSLVDPRFGAPVLSYPNYLDLKNRNNVMSGLITYRIAPVNASLSEGQNTRLWGYVVSGNYFEVLGVNADRGRVLSPSDDVKRGGNPVAVISYLCWQRRFGGVSDVVGRTFKMNGLPYTILGVTPAGFQGTERFYLPEFYVPASMTSQIEPGSNYADSRDTQNTFVLGRLKNGVSKKQAEAGINVLTKQLADEYPKVNEGWKLTLVEPGWGGDFLRGGVIAFSSVLFGVAVVLLLVVCVNLTSLLLAQASERRKETAIRLAIGAGKWHLVRQLLMESLVLAVLGGALGLLATSWTLELISNIKPPIDFALDTNISMDSNVVWFCLAVTLLTSVLLGLAPAWQSTRTDLSTGLKNDSADSRRRKWPLRDVLVAAQIALSVVLVAVSGLMLRSLQNALHVNIGFNPQNAAAMSMELGLQGYDKAKGRRFQKELLRMARENALVQSATIAGGIPLDLGFSNNSAYEEGQPVPPASKMPLAQYFEVYPGFFTTMQTPLIAGRDFAEQEGEQKQPVLVVNRAFTRKILKLDNPELAVGKRVRTGGTTHQIVAVAEDGKYVSLSEDAKPVMFYNAMQRYTAETRLIWRTHGRVEDSIAPLRAIVQQLDPEMTITHAETMEQHLNLPLLPSRFAAGTLAVFGSVILLLAAIGIYGVMAFAVVRRTREIGIRVAIGASPGQVAGLIIRRGAWLVGIGAFAGLILAILTAGQIAPLLIGVNPRDPATHVLGLLVMGAIALLACWIPARQAMALDPNRALRRD